MNGFSPVRRAAVWTVAFAGAGLFLTMATMATLHAWRADRFTLLILLPYLLSFGWLAILFGLRASIRAHLALAVTTAILAIATAVAYVPVLKNGHGGCMSFLILFSYLPFAIGFPVVFIICWFLFGLERHD